MTYKRTEGKLKVDYGLSDYYKYYKQNENNPVDNKKFNKIVSEFNKEIVNLIIEENLEFTPVKLQFTFCVRKYKKVPQIKEGKLINTNPIDWKTTNELWEENSEAKEKKIIIKFNNNHTSKNIFRIKALKVGTTYKNKYLFRFKAIRSFRALLSKRILDPNKDNFNTFNLY
jgi:hypothetical protein